MKKRIIPRDVSSEDIKCLCRAQLNHFKQHLRPSMNEWMIQDFEEWRDLLQSVLEKDRKNKIITKEKYQEWLAIASDFYVELMEMIQRHEKEEDYLNRLCNPISS